MHDPEKFQKETVKAITDLQNIVAQTLSRQLALNAVVRALVAQVPPAALHQVIEEFDASVDHLAAQLPPAFQRPKYWEEWAAVLEDMRKQQQP